MAIRYLPNGRPVPVDEAKLKRRKKPKRYESYSIATPSTRMPTAPVVSPVERQIRDIALAYHKVYRRMPAPDKVFDLMQGAPAGGMKTTEDWVEFFTVANPLEVDPNKADEVFEGDTAPFGAGRPRSHKDLLRERKGEAQPSFSKVTDTGRVNDTAKGEDGGGAVDDDYQYTTNGNYKLVKKKVFVGGGKGSPGQWVETDEWEYRDENLDNMGESDYYAGIGIEPAKQGGLQFRMFGGGDTSKMMPAEDVKFILKFFDRKHYTDHYDAYKAAIKAGTRPAEDDYDAHKSWINLAGWVSRATGDNSHIENVKGGRDFDQWNTKLLNAYLGGLVERYLPYYAFGNEEQQKQAKAILANTGMNVEAMLPALNAMSYNEPEKLNQMLFDGFVRWRPGNQSEEAAKYEYSNLFGKDRMPAPDAAEMQDQKWGALDDIGEAALVAGKGAAGALGYVAGKAGAATGWTFHHIPGHGYVQAGEEAIADSPVGRALDESTEKVGRFLGAVGKGIVGTSAEYAQFLSRGMTSVYWVATAELWDAVDPDAAVFKGANRHDFEGDGLWDRYKVAWENSGEKVESFVKDGVIWKYSMDDGKYHAIENPSFGVLPSEALDVVPKDAAIIKAASGAQWVTREFMNDLFIGTGLSDNPENLPLIGSIAFAADMAIGLKFDVIGDFAIRYGAKYTAKGAFAASRGIGSKVATRAAIKGINKAEDTLLSGGKGVLHYRPGYVKWASAMSGDAKRLLSDGEQALRKQLADEGLDEAQVHNRLHWAKRYAARKGDTSFDMDAWYDESLRKQNAIERGKKMDARDAQVRKIEAESTNTGPLRAADRVVPRAPVLISRDGVLITAGVDDFPADYSFRGDTGLGGGIGQAGQIYHEDVKEIAGISQDATEWGHVRIDDRLSMGEDQLILSMGNFSVVDYTEDFVQNAVTDMVAGGYVPKPMQVVIAGWSFSPTTREVVKEGTQHGSQKLQMLSPQAYKALKDAGYAGPDIAAMQRGQKDFPNIDELLEAQAAQDTVRAIDELRVDPMDDLLPQGKRWSPEDEGLTDEEYWAQYGGAQGGPSVLYSRKPREVGTLHQVFRGEAKSTGNAKADAAIKAAKDKQEEYGKHFEAHQTASAMAAGIRDGLKLPAGARVRFSSTLSTGEVIWHEGVVREAHRYGYTKTINYGIEVTSDTGEVSVRTIAVDNGTPYDHTIELLDEGEKAKHAKEVAKQQKKLDELDKVADEEWVAADKIRVERDKLSAKAEKVYAKEVGDTPPAVMAARESAATAPAPKPKRTPKPAPTPTKQAKPKVRKSKDFAETGGWDIETSDGRSYTIHYDNGSGNTVSGWYLTDAYPDANTGSPFGFVHLGDNRTEALEKLQAGDPLAGTKYEQKGTNGAKASLADAVDKAIDAKEAAKAAAKKGAKAAAPSIAAQELQPPKTLAEWVLQLRKVLPAEQADDATVDRLGALLGANAAYLGMDTDEFVTSRLLGVVRGEEAFTYGGKPVTVKIGDTLYKLAPGDPNYDAIVRYAQVHYGSDWEDYRDHIVKFISGGFKNAATRRRVLEHVVNSELPGDVVDMNRNRLVVGSSKLEPASATFALSPNEKTVMSVDFSTNCPFRAERACFYCYVELARGAAEVQMADKGIDISKAYGNTKAKTVVGHEASSFDTDWIDNMDDATVGFFNSVGGMRLFSFGDFEEATAESIEEFLQAAQRRGLRVKAITKQQEFIDRFAKKYGDTLWVNYSTDLDPEHVTKVLRGKTKGDKKLQTLLGDDALRSAVSNTPTLKVAHGIASQHPNVVVRYVAALGDDEFALAVMDPRIGVVTPLHASLGAEKLQQVWKITMPEYFEKGIGAGPDAMESLAEQLVRRNHPGEYLEGGRLQVLQKDLDRIFGPGKVTEKEFLRNVALKTCCTTGRCGECGSCCGRFAKDAGILWKMEQAGVPQASIQFFADGKALMRGFEAATPYAFSHETGHLFRRLLDGEDLRTARKWAGLDPDGADPWDELAEEKFAEAFATHFDEYVKTGKLPDPLHESVMAKFKDWMVRLWANIKGTPLEKDMDKELHKLFDKFAEPLRLEQQSKRIGFRGYFGPPGQGSLPLFLNNHAEFIARLKPGTKSEWWLKHLYNLSDHEANTVIDVYDEATMTHVKKTAVQALAEEQDPVKVHALLNKLADNPYGFIIDPWQAATWKMWRMKYVTGNLDHQHPAFIHQLTTPLVDQTKSSNESADLDILRIGMSVNLPNGKTALGRTAYDYAEQMFAAKTGAAKAEVWDTFWKDVESTMRKQPKRISKMVARKLGVEQDSIDNMWDYWEAYRTAYYRAKGKPKAAFASGRAYKGKAKQVQNEKGELETTIVEESAVIPSKLAQRLAAEVEKADADFEAALARTDLKPEAKKALEAARDEAKARFAEYQRNPEAFRMAQPFFQGQLRKGYLHPFDPAVFQKFTAGRVARAWEFNQVKKRGGLLGYSIDEWITAYKELVMSTSGFPIRVTVGDEGVRLFTEGIISPYHPQRTMATIKGVGGKSFLKKGGVQELIANGSIPEELIEDLSLWTRSHSDDFVTINVGAPKYASCLRAELQMVQNEPMFKHFDRLLTKHNGNMKKTVAEMKKLLKSNTDEGAELRQMLVQTHRLTQGQADNPRGLNFGKMLHDTTEAGAELAERQNPLTEWLDQWADYMTRLDSVGFQVTLKAGDMPTPMTLRTAIRDGNLPSEDILKQVPPDKLWPVTMRNEPWKLGDGGVELPFVHWFAQNVTFKMMESFSNRMRSMVFTGRYQREMQGIHERAARLGQNVDMAQAHELASHRALAYTNSVQYTHNATIFEDLSRNTLMFMPAYRQYLTYWSKYAIKEPLVMARLQGARAGEKDTPKTMGDFSGFMPSIPFGWDVPTFSPLVTVPLRAVNYTSGGKLRGMEDLPFLSFTNPRTSVLSRFDDLLWGMFGANIPGLSSDKTVREMTALRIAQGQIANGIKPNVEQGLEEMRNAPGWYRFIEATFGKPADLISDVRGGAQPLESHPEGVVSFLSKQFLPMGLTYMPQNSRDMLQAEFAWTKATTADQRLAVITRYPDYGKLLGYRRMTLTEKEAFLQDPDNVHLIPFVVGKNNYDNAGLLMGYEDYYNALQRGEVSRKHLLEYATDVKNVRDAVVNTATIEEAKKNYDRQLKKSKRWAEQIALSYTHGRRNNMFRAMMSDWENPHYRMNADGVTDIIPQWPFNQKGGLEHSPAYLDQQFKMRWNTEPLLVGHRTGNASNWELDVNVPGYHPPNKDELNALYRAKELGAYGKDLDYTPGRTPYFTEYRAHQQKIKTAKIKNVIDMSTDGFWDLDTWSIRQMGIPVRSGWDEARAKHNHGYQMLKNEADRKAYWGTKDYNEAKAKYIREGERFMDKYAPYMRKGTVGRLMANKYLVDPRYDPDLHMSPKQLSKADRKNTLVQANRAIDVLDKWYKSPEAAYAAVDKMMERYGYSAFKKAFGGDEKADQQAKEFIAEEFRATWWRAMLTLFYRGRERLRLDKNEYHKEYLGTTTGSKDGERVLHNLLKNVTIIQDVEKRYGIESGFVAEWRELGGATLGRALLDWAR
jgi:hypothetical protein